MQPAEIDDESGPWFTFGAECCLAPDAEYIGAQFYVASKPEHPQAHPHRERQSARTTRHSGASTGWCRRPRRLERPRSAGCPTIHHDRVPHHSWWGEAWNSSCRPGATGGTPRRPGLPYRTTIHDL